MLNGQTAELVNHRKCIALLSTCDGRSLNFPYLSYDGLLTNTQNFNRKTINLYFYFRVPMQQKKCPFIEHKNLTYLCVISKYHVR